MKLWRTLILIVIGLSVSFPGLLCAAIPASERAALIAFYNSTNGDNWNNNSGWKTAPLHSDGFAMPGTENDWYGIGTASGHVYKISYYYNNLSGSLPESFWDLTYLEEVLLQGGTMTGTIPANIVQLSRIVTFNVMSNRLSGTIPANIVNLTTLKKLYLGSNQLTGTLPAGLDKLVNLQWFSVVDNQLTGTIPAEIGNLKNLLHLDLGVNQFSGAIPPELGGLQRVTFFRLCNNQLTGSIPSQLGDMITVQSINLSDNRLTGAIPSQLQNLKALETLSIGNNQLTGSVPAWLGSLPVLGYLHFSYNKLSGPLPAEIGKLSGLWVLYGDNNQLDGSLPPEYGNLGKLNHMNLSFNNLSGPIPSEFGKLSVLQYLDIHHNALSGPLPSELGNCTGLLNFRASENELTGEIPAAFSKLVNLEILWLYKNHLQGNLPPFIDEWSNLNTLLLHCNNFNGSIPASLCTLTGLKHLNLSFNTLTGEIPVSIVDMSSLTNSYDWTTFSYNGLYTNNPAVKSFLDNLMPNWDITQALPPGKLTALPLSASSIRVSWESPPSDAIVTGCEVYYSTLQGGPYQVAGQTASKSDLFFDVSGLLPGTAYYFIVKSRAGHYCKTQNQFSSVPSTETSAVTLLIPGTHGLNVRSSPSAAVPISVAPADYFGNTNGITPFSRLYNQGAVVTLTAPVSFESRVFSAWQVDGADVSTSSVLSIAMDAGHTVTAVYKEEDPPPAGTFRLTVQSSPSDGGVITVSPADTNAQASGTTAFTRIYDEGTVVSLIAPVEFNGSAFVKWTIDGADRSGTSVTVTMDRHHTVVAVYQDDTPQEPVTLVVESTHASGTPVTLSPADLNGDSSGMTRFTRSYNKGTTVTLTAPEEHNGHIFDHWSVDGQKVTSSVTLTFTIGSDHKAKAFYVTPAHPGLVVRPVKLNFGVIEGEVPASQTLRVTITNSPVHWTAAAGDRWLSLGAASGYGSAEVAVSIDSAGLEPGKYKSAITVTAPGADHSPQSVTVNLTLYQSGTTARPTGDFATPVDGATVSGSIAVTGWVVDDTGVESVKIFREGAHKNDLIYIGDAVFVEGARPDVEALFPEYPESNKAGWGYMLLTHFLPDGGNGTFKLHAIAGDEEGFSVDLGVKTIICDNANAVKPFGAIDTPDQGGSASGETYVNWGWVLTPQPAAIPGDGSTISVWIDGVHVGNPVYNIFRADIAALFPGYANSDGAVGYFYLDTTGYEDGLHTIQWLAVDSMGHSDGIGSRYFTVDNAGLSPPSGQSSCQVSLPSSVQRSASDVSSDNCRPVAVQKGFDLNGKREVLYPSEPGEICVSIKELERVEIDLGGASEMLTPPPIGSSFDGQRGVFYWQPGAGFLGDYVFEFMCPAADGRKTRKRVTITIEAAPHPPST